MILWCSYSDYSNLCQGFSDSLNAVGVESENYSLTKHIFYDNNVLSAAKMIEKMEKADVIVMGHTNDLILDLCRDLGKKLIVLHTGTSFRQNPEKYNEIFKGIESWTDSPEFMKYGCKHYIHAAIDTNTIKPDFTFYDMTFAHYPSKSEVKGTLTIKKIIEGFDSINFLCNTDLVSHEKHLQRVSKCDFYIEMLSTTQNGNIYGSFGVSSSEAACLGKIVLTNSLFHSVYEDAYDDYGEMIICNSENELSSAINSLIHLTEEDILLKKKQTREWVVENHSFYATGLYLKQLLGI